MVESSFMFRGIPGSSKGIGGRLAIGHGGYRLAGFSVEFSNVDV